MPHRLTVQWILNADCSSHDSQSINPCSGADDRPRCIIQFLFCACFFPFSAVYFYNSAARRLSKAFDFATKLTCEAAERPKYLKRQWKWSIEISVYKLFSLMVHLPCTTNLLKATGITLFCSTKLHWKPKMYRGRWIVFVF